MKEHDLLGERPDNCFAIERECLREAGIHGVQQTEDGLIADPLVLVLGQIDQVSPCIQNEPSV